MKKILFFIVIMTVYSATLYAESTSKNTGERAASQTPCSCIHGGNSKAEAPRCPNGAPSSEQGYCSDGTRSELKAGKATSK
jgi:hypothetical protein